MPRSESQTIRESAAARALVDSFFAEVEARSNGDWVRARDVFVSVFAAHPDNAYVRYLTEVSARQIKFTYDLQLREHLWPQIEREKRGSHQSAPVYYRSRGFTALEGETRAKAAWARWRSALEDGATSLPGGGVWLQRESLYARFETPKPRGCLKSELRTSISGENFAIELNEPNDLHYHNGATTVALGPDGMTYLLRQGILHEPGGPQIDGQTFASATGRAARQLRFERGLSDRPWHIVACLDHSDAEIRRQTALFVADCELARGWPLQSPSTQAALIALQAAEEVGGAYLVGRKSETPGSWVTKWQGEVLQALSARLKVQGRRLRKVVSNYGYGVDGVVETSKKPLLLEVKSSARASDLHQGVGQLLLYRRLFSDFADHKPVLLVRGTPPSILADAVRGCDIVLATYEISVEKPHIVTFDPAFLKLCELN